MLFEISTRSFLSLVDSFHFIVAGMRADWNDNFHFDDKEFRPVASFVVDNLHDALHVAENVQKKAIFHLGT